MKTIKEWLESLPEPHRTQALANASDSLTTTTPSLTSAIAGGFAWAYSPEGYEYWDDFFHTIDQQETPQTP